MPPRGRKPKPEQVKEAQGTARPDRVRDNTVEFPAVREPTDPPVWVRGRFAVQLWKKLEPLLRTQGVLTEADLEPLGHLCNLHQKLVRKMTIVVHREYRAACSEFGLTPASRARVPRGGEAKPTNRFAGLKRG